jgi:hypothetical protein
MVSLPLTALFSFAMRNDADTNNDPTVIKSHKKTLAMLFACANIFLIISPP